jgi:hypothetical protein
MAIATLLACGLVLGSTGGKAQAQEAMGTPRARGGRGHNRLRLPERRGHRRPPRHIGGTVAALGDNAYPHGSAEDYQNCYDTSWGAYKAQTMPAVGNHEYETAGASGYFGAAGDPAKDYYSYDLGSWHVMVLSGNCSHVAGGAPRARRRSSG